MKLYNGEYLWTPQDQIRWSINRMKVIFIQKLYIKQMVIWLTKKLTHESK